MGKQTFPRKEIETSMARSAYRSTISRTAENVDFGTELGVIIHLVAIEASGACLVSRIRSLTIEGEKRNTVRTGSLYEIRRAILAFITVCFRSGTVLFGEQRTLIFIIEPIGIIAFKTFIGSGRFVFAV
jgi:hypothetical protein